MVDATRRDILRAAAATAGGVLLSSSAQGASTMADPSLTKALDAVFGAHMDAELAGDLDKTLATMAPNPHIVNVPTMVGGQGPARPAYGPSTPTG